MTRYIFVLLLLAAILFVVFTPIQGYAQDKYFVSASFVGSLPIDDKAGTHQPGLGFTVMIDRQIGDKLTIGMSYLSTKIWGEVDAKDFQIEEYDLVSRFHLKNIGLDTKLNFYLSTGSGWTLFNPDGESKESNIGALIGFGVVYQFYVDMSVDAGFLVRSFGDANTFQPSVGLKFPLPL